MAKALVTVFRTVFWFHCAFTASKVMHTRMVWSVLRAPMSFFHSTPLGRITNRFSEDVGILDVDLPEMMNNTIMANGAVRAMMLHSPLAWWWHLTLCVTRQVLTNLLFVAYASPLQLLVIPVLLASACSYMLVWCNCSMLSDPCSFSVCCRCICPCGDARRRTCAAVSILSTRVDSTGSDFQVSHPQHLWRSAGWSHLTASPWIAKS